MYTINQQDVIFDAASAKSEYETKSKQIPIKNKKARRFNYILCIFLLALGAAIALLAFWLLGPGGVLYHQEFHIFFLMLGLGTALVIPLIIYNEFSADFLYSWEWYSLNAKYGMLIADKTVLKHEVKYSDTFGQRILYLTLEDTDHVVSEKIISHCNLKFITRTDINRPTLDLPNESVYLPYEG